MFRKIYQIILLGILFCCFTNAWGIRKKVLIMHSYHEGLSWTDNVNRGIRSVFEEDGSIELHFEYLDSKRNADSTYFSKLYDLFKTKYHNSPFDVILVSDNNALQFLLDHREEFYEDIPVVFCGINNPDGELLKKQRTITGVEENPDFKGTIELILQLHPDMQQLVVINDNRTVTSRLIACQIHDFWDALNTDVKLQLVSDLTHAELIKYVKELGQGSVILLTLFNVDREGQFISFQENLEMISEVTRVPVYSGWEFYLGKGIVGGILTSGFEQGRLAAQMGLQIINGMPADSIPIVKDQSNRLQFDYNQIVRFHIKPGKLPKEATIINKPPGFWELYKVWMTLILFFILLSIGLVYLNEQRNRIKAMRLEAINKELDERVEEKTKALRQANASLQQQKQFIERQNKELDKHRNNLVGLVKERTSELEMVNKKLKAGRQRLLMMLDASSDGVWEYNLETGAFMVSNRTWERLGYMPDEVEENIHFMLTLIHPDDRALVQERLQNYLNGQQEIYHIEFRIRKNNGQWLWFQSRGKQLEWKAGKGIVLMVGTHMDITERKQSEERLRAGERRWRALYDQVQECIVICDIKGHLIDANPNALEILNYEPHEIHGLTLGHLDVNHELGFILNNYFNQLSARESTVNYESVIRRHDNTTFPAEINLNRIEYSNERFVLTTIRDISKRQEVERQVLNAIIKTEEKERSRFAKDLHDSIGPLLSSLKLYLSTLEKTTSDERRKKIFALSEEAIKEAVTTIREISNNLSPQTLADYGLKSALNAFLQRLNATHVIQASLDAIGMEKRLPSQEEVALYRVVTELVNNTIKHSGASQLHIQIVQREDELELNYMDNGKGFSEGEGHKKGGMGLFNIANRLKSVDGSVAYSSTEEWGFVAQIRMQLK